MGSIAARFSGKALCYLLLTAWLLAVTLPFLWVLTTSLRSTEEIFQSPFGFPNDAKGSFTTNYSKAWVESGFSKYFVNSLIVVFSTLVLIGVFACPTAYALARYNFRVSKWLLVYFLSGMMVPVQLLLVPLFFQYKDWSHTLTRILHPLFEWLGRSHVVVSLTDSQPGLVLMYTALSLPFTIFVLNSFFRTLPTELYEAGVMDGCGEFRAFFHVMLPMARPGLITAGIFNFIGLWNEYFLALVFINTDRYKTLPLGLAAVSIQANYRSDFGLLFAALVIVMLPTLFVYTLLQRHLTQGITLGALKG